VKKRAYPKRQHIIINVVAADVLDETMLAAINKALNAPLPDETEPPLCADCVHCNARRCHRPTEERDLVDGGYKLMWGRADDERKADCGPAGRYFKARPPTWWQRFKAGLRFILNETTVPR
jgi:hypothetical protein